MEILKMLKFSISFWQKGIKEDHWNFVHGGKKDTPLNPFEDF